MRRPTPFALAVLLLLAGRASADTTVTPLDFEGRPAFRLSDGKTQAVVVPSLARVMSFGPVGGPELLWRPEPGWAERQKGWKNFGGDKTWPGPQSQWWALVGSDFPPDPTWDVGPHEAKVTDVKTLVTTGPVMKHVGVRLTREYAFNAAGEFEVRQTFELVDGPPRMLSIWSVTQVPHPDAAYVPLNPASPYKDEFFWWPGVKRPQTKQAAQAASPTMLRVRPTREESFKVGADAPVAAIVAVRAGAALCVRADRPGGAYPDGAEGAGFPVEYYNNGSAEAPYVELELLSPLYAFRKAGDKHTHTVRWSVQRLPNADPESAESRKAIEGLLAP